MTALVRFYPRAWRERYETEFLDLLADRPPRWTDRLDILLGAVDAHLQPEVPDPAAASETSRRRIRWDVMPAVLAFLGGVLWVAVVGLLRSAPVNAYGERESDVALVLAWIAQVSLAGASLALGRRMPATSPLPALAGAIMLVGAGLFLLGWPWIALGIYGGFLASALVGLAIVRAGGRVGIGLAAASVVACGVNTESDLTLLVLPLGLAWMAVGAWTLTRHGRRSAPDAHDRRAG